MITCICKCKKENIMKVFIAGSASPNINKKYLEGINEIANFLTNNQIGIICVGTQAGSVGEMYKHVTSKNGLVDLIVPKVYYNEADGMDASNSTIVVDTLYELQQIAIAQTDATVVLPGGNGTLAELYMLTDNIKAKLHNDPIIIYNCNGFYDKIKEMNDFMLKAGTLEPFQYKFFNFCNTPEEVINLLKQYLKL